jgi:tetratricopeptide (TPR) repeat protein
MTPRARIWTIVAAASVAAVGLTVAAVAVTRDEPAPPAGEPPPLFLDLGVRDDEEARALREAVDLYEAGRLDEAGAIFDRYDSLEARIGSAFADWPDTLTELGGLPRDRAAVRLHTALALATIGRELAARAELVATGRTGPDTPYAVRADDILHPRFVPGLPIFVPSAEFPAELEQLTPAAQLDALAADETALGRIRYGAALQRLGRPVSARRAFNEAAVLAPRNPEALAADAVGRFDKDDLAQSFGRLGPLTRQFPQAQSPRFHLGLLLLWTGDIDGAKRQLRAARALGPATRLGREAKRFLDRL